MRGLTRILTVEAKLVFRDPITWIVVLVLPTAILLILGAVFAPHRPDPLLDGQRFIDLFVPSLLVISLATLGLQTLPIRLATYREKGVLRRLSTTPVHPARLLLVQLVMYIVLALVSLGALVVAGHLAFAIPLPREPLWYVAAFLLGMSSLFALGLLVAAVAPNARTATALGLPMFFLAMFLGGVYLPKWFLPDLLEDIGAFIPPGVEGLQYAWLGEVPDLLPLVVLTAITVVAGIAAVRLFRWE
jgi:ABC-2 type transport system permease protein